MVNMLSLISSKLVFKKCLKWSKWSKLVLNGTKCSKMFKNVPKWSNMVKYDLIWSNMVNMLSLRSKWVWQNQVSWSSFQGNLVHYKL